MISIEQWTEKEERGGVHIGGILRKVNERKTGNLFTHLPEEHPWHSVEPDWTEYCPAGHGRQDGFPGWD
jgi:hypothetical protein